MATQEFNSANQVGEGACSGVFTENEQAQAQSQAQRDADLLYSCDVISISGRGSGSGSESEESNDWSDPFSSVILAATTAAAATATTEEYPRIDPNDPLMYFQERGEITPNEYDKWKLVNEERRAQIQPQPIKYKRKTPDFGPGYNSDSDPDSGDEDEGPTIEFGHGYSVWADEHTDPFDPWNPNPDPTSDRRYTKLATDCTFMMKRLTQPETRQGNNHNLNHNLKLSNSFELKLMWERFTLAASSMQEFWQTSALPIYEALQNLRADHARVRRSRSEEWCKNIQIPTCPECHTTPVEVLENTFETIGRMCRCIAEDFNTPSVVAYVEEFIITLYREIEFNALVEEYEDRIYKAEWDRQQEQRQPFSSVFSKEQLQQFIDIQMQKAVDPTYRAELMTTDEWLAKKRHGQ